MAPQPTSIGTHKINWACSSVALPPGSPSLDSELWEGDGKIYSHAPHSAAQGLAQDGGEGSWERSVGCVNEQSLE